MFSSVLVLVQFFFSVIIGIYFLGQLRTQQGNRDAIREDSKKELERLRRLEQIKLTQPLSEKTRPSNFNEIVGQAQGIKALQAALCGPNPQHVIIYGPPGVGKTAAARLVLDKAISMHMSPFTSESKFIETDATTMRFDERNIADPLIGSVHDPIYQGAGAYGPAGVPQPKPGAVTKAHGGILFIDEVGELHPVQMNRLLKVLEDRRVFLESAYYSSGDKNIPPHVHRIFQEGLPADFRLIGATTRAPEDIPAAIRSRCVEVFFRPLSCKEVEQIADNAAKKGGFTLDAGGAAMVARYANNGRDAVNIVQIAGSVALMEGRYHITIADLEWVIEFGQHSPRLERRIAAGSEVGVVNGLAVTADRCGAVMEIEATAEPCERGKGSITVTGIVEQEEIDGRGQKLRRTSTARAAVDNVLTVLREKGLADSDDYHIHLNFPGGAPVDGPSAGIAMLCAIYSAMYGVAVPCTVAMTGEVSIMGKVKPVGGVVSKVDAAMQAGVNKVLIPADNHQELFDTLPIEVIRVRTVDEVLLHCFGENAKRKTVSVPQTMHVMTAEGYK
ncbi:MAG: ATP-dependent protease LonB [Ruminococcaceae bacterium]|nr:ATP-dependent protease LonB [Oscillospiraceae bacterium]